MFHCSTANWLVGILRTTEPHSDLDFLRPSRNVMFMFEYVGFFLCLNGKQSRALPYRNAGRSVWIHILTISYTFFVERIECQTVAGIRGIIDRTPMQYAKMDLFRSSITFDTETVDDGERCWLTIWMLNTFWHYKHAGSVSSMHLGEPREVLEKGSDGGWMAWVVSGVCS